MLIIPAIDLMNGKCVRLKQGKFDDEVRTFGDPVEIANKLKEKGVEYLHIIDLDGAKRGKPANFEVVKKIIEKTNLKIQLGGGFRTKEDIDKALGIGVSRVIIGTSAIENREFLSSLIEKIGKERMVVSVDVKNNKVYGKGWTESSEIDYLEYLKELEKIGCERILLTAIERDGMMKGPDFELISKVAKETNMKIIVAGGISKKQDIEELRNFKIEGAVIGKAIYVRSIKIEEVI